MGKEIERKFLVDRALWQQTDKPEGEHYRQGYLMKDMNKTLRVRLSRSKCTLTLKGPLSGISRDEFEYEIPSSDALEMFLSFAPPEVSKVRYKVLYEGKIWEVDEFLEDNAGLFIAEIELGAEVETFSLPPWAGEEVTGQKKYYNSSLAIEPYKRWQQ